MQEETKEEFRARVFTLIGAIPVGNVATYGQIAGLAGAPKHARAVGYLLKHLPAGSSLPWHRVINSQGKISFPPESSKFIEQSQLLRSEGVKVQGGKIALRQYQWC
ncbi:MGMT family protein [Pseudoalteromonas ardens]|uniref:Cysteine methyltransferase n=1 Tax=Pseudoalteromonas rubra TaxID=43658 RepID=A0A0L0EPK9_9GAMM|nr:MGMT family protein [Pseudoalteromonas sp. R96]KNC66310.1 cysteine methyltransferase [Pseudoalteromonas rubra]MDK1309959.1 MGMT family protein [Pseudoalteromonas sp. R96]